MRVLIALLFLLVSQNICLSASYAAASAPPVFKIEFDTGIKLKFSPQLGELIADLVGSSASVQQIHAALLLKGGASPEILLDEPLKSRLEGLIQAALDALMQNACAQRLIADISQNKNAAITQHFTSLYLDPVPQILEAQIRALTTTVVTAGSPTYIVKQFNDAMTRKQAQFIESAKHHLYVLLQEHIAQDHDEISEDLDSAITARIQELQALLAFPDYPAIWPLFIAQFVHGMVDIAIQEKSISDAIIFCLFIDPKLVIGRCFQTSVTDCNDAIQQAASDSHIHILVKKYKTCFADIKKDQLKLAIKLNIEDIIKGPAINVLKRNATKHYLINGDGHYLLDKENSDLSVLLMHEFIHMSHFVENTKIFERDRTSMVSPYWSMLYDDMPNADHEFTRLWQDAEEQRTVIGRPGFSDISELSVRVSSDMPVRYPYSIVDDQFVSSRIISAIRPALPTIKIE